MTKGRPFTDTTFRPNGRPFKDPTHANYEWFNGGEKPEVEEPVTERVIETEETEELVELTTISLILEDDITGTVTEEDGVEDTLKPTIVGTDAGEKIKGTRGDDIIFGGLGADKFKVKKGDDIILDFQVGVDSIKGKFKDVELSFVDSGDVRGTLMEHKKGSVLFNELELAAVDIFG